MSSKTPRIELLMLIDDSQIDMMLYQRVIKRSGVVADTISFSLAVNALAHLQKDDARLPDVIFLDINMPRMDGFEFLEAVNALFGPDFSPVVIMLTTSLDPADEARAKQFAQVKAYVNKPLTIEQVNMIVDLV